MMVIKDCGLTGEDSNPLPLITEIYIRSILAHTFGSAPARLPFKLS